MDFVLSSEFAQAMVKFLICIVVNWIIIFQLYFRKSHRRDFSFTFMLMSIAIYFLVFFMMGMERGKATMGVGLGLFGIFSIMRYRTDAMPVREMTYLFLIICLSVVHAMASEYIVARAHREREEAVASHVLHVQVQGVADHEAERVVERFAHFDKHVAVGGHFLDFKLGRAAGDEGHRNDCGKSSEKFFHHVLLDGSAALRR